MPVDSASRAIKFCLFIFAYSTVKCSRVFFALPWGWSATLSLVSFPLTLQLFTIILLLKAFCSQHEYFISLHFLISDNSSVYFFCVGVLVDCVKYFIYWWLRKFAVIVSEWNAAQLYCFVNKNIYANKHSMIPCGKSLDIVYWLYRFISSPSRDGLYGWHRMWRSWTI